MTRPEQVQAEARQALSRLLAICLAREASDLHLTPGAPPYLRTHGHLEVMDEPKLGAAWVDTLAEALLTPTGLDRLRQRGSADGAFTDEQGVRFRLNAYRRRGQTCLALRRLEDTFRTLEALGLPKSLYELSGLPDGLVLIAGPTGSGKSTTIATLIDRINETRPCHVITIEDPVEYVHHNKRAMVNQREIGLDATSFNEALVAAMRQDPDVILLGEVRDLETIRTAITAAETGHLVFASVHAGDAPSTIERVAAVFPTGEQEGIRRQLGLTLRAVISQHLLIADGPQAEVLAEGRRPRVVVSEILRVTPAVANLIATGKTNQIYSAIESGATQGMQTMEADLARLMLAGLISEQAATAMARNPQLVLDRLNQQRVTTRGPAGVNSRRRSQGAYR